MSHKKSRWHATLLLACLCAVPATAQDNKTVQFSFEGTPWREVIRWIADESELALHVGDLPTGSFTYSDKAEFTHEEAISRINLFLVPQGFTLVKSGRLLSVINMSDPRSMQQLDTMAEMVRVDQLADRKSHEVLKCIFPLGEIDADEAVQELTALNLMLSPTILSKTNQLIITDTAGKLRNVQAVISAFDSTNPEDPIVKRFQLKNADVEDVMTAVRPHVGLATGENIGIDISISTDPLGKKIFVTGLEDKVKIVEGLIMEVDKPEETTDEDLGPAVVQAHAVSGGNLETVYSVLQTLMSGKKTIRVSRDDEADSIVALAPPSIQKEIADTIKEIEASDADFEVIPLRTVDPFFAISLLEQMLDLPDPLLDEPEDIDPNAPKIDADPANMRLFVRAKKSQIEQIKKIVEGLESTSVTSDGNTIRMLPLRGRQAEQILDTAAKFWRDANPIVLYKSNDSAAKVSTERVVNATPEDRLKTQPTVQQSELPSPKMLTSTHGLRQAALIRCQLTPRGLLIQSDDSDALDRFEDHLRMITGPIEMTPSEPIAFYLKYTKAEDAIRMLAELLDGGETVLDESGSSLVNGYVSSASGLLGSFLTTRDGTTTLTYESITIVADSRLNRLITQGTTEDIEKVEAYLRIIDKDKSLTDVETYGTSHVIELMHAKASDVAKVLQDAYAGRIAKSQQQAQPQQGQPQQQQPKKTPEQQKQEAQAKKQQAQKKSSAPRNTEPTMTVAVHEPSNSLIVTAPQTLFEQVEKLCKSLDAKAEQEVQVIAPVNAELYGSLIEQIITGESTNTGSRSSRPSGDRDRK